MQQAGAKLGVSAKKAHFFTCEVVNCCKTDHINVHMANSPKSAHSATMHSVAEKLDLSIATVSRALRRVPGINPETRARVLQAAAELGYRLPQSYRSAAPTTRDRLQHVGIFIETNNSNLSHPYLTGLTEAALSLNISLVIHQVKPGECARVLEPGQQPRAMRSGLLAGIVLLFWWPAEVVAALSNKLPTVSIMHKYTGANVDMVGLDNEGGMEMLLRRLHAAGHRRIGFLGRCSRLHWSTARFGGYVAGLASLGIEYDPALVVDVEFDAISSIEGDWKPYEDTVMRITERHGVTAWMSATEPGGWALYEWFTAMGLKVPGDMSVTGFHRPTNRETARHDLTSVSASYEAMGSAALKRLQFRINNPAETSRSILFPCEYFPGSSVGPCP
ncbi:hypothetical protein DB346_20250 [Verrucomicrobia bacterium LW23]|nr:hypothetical protein DB346_20250 [Verrucomicrobia bacterium LW23]